MTIREEGVLVRDDCRSAKTVLGNREGDEMVLKMSVA